MSQPVKIWGLLPHTHLRGTRWQYKLEQPDGTSEIVLDVPRYDFNWQTYYLFATPLEIPAGGKLTSMAWYDNSTIEQVESGCDDRREVGRSDVGGDAVHGHFCTASRVADCGRALKPGGQEESPSSR